MKLFRGIKQLVSLQDAHKKRGRHVQEADLSIIENACILTEQGKIVFVGPEVALKSQLAERWSEIQKAQDIDLKADTVIPAFVEPHTHLIFAGDRSQEFELRNQGVSYQEIAAKGGGILSTLKDTRRAGFDQLLTLAQQRVGRFVAQGVTCIEVKSGYGLDLESEIKMLQVGRALKGPKIVTSFLGAHAKPAEFSTQQEYLNFLENKVLPEVLRQKLADRIDIFIEKGFFEAEASKALLSKALGAGLKLTVHADQLSLSGGTELALEFEAQSADHVIEISEDVIKKLATSKTVAVLLPAADFYMDCAFPRARSLIDNGACVALATDFNPGSSPTQDLSLVGVLARLKMKMTQSEVLAAYTVGAAHSLGLEDERGSLEASKFADFTVINGSWKELFYQIGHHPVRSVYRLAEKLEWSDSEKS